MIDQWIGDDLDEDGLKKIDAGNGQVDGIESPLVEPPGPNNSTVTLQV